MRAAGGSVPSLGSGAAAAGQAPQGGTGLAWRGPPIWGLEGGIEPLFSPLTSFWGVPIEGRSPRGIVAPRPREGCSSL